MWNLSAYFIVKALASGDIRLRIETTEVNESFRLFYQIKTEEGGYIIVDWGGTV